MRFLIDESADTRIASPLRRLDHDVTTVAGDHGPALQDTDVLAIAHREQRILITNDKDFGDLIFQRELPHTGIILLRLPLDSTAQQKIAALERLFATHQDQLFRYVVVTPRGVRVR